MMNFWVIFFIYFHTSAAMNIHVPCDSLGRPDLRVELLVTARSPVHQSWSSQWLPTLPKFGGQFSGLILFDTSFDAYLIHDFYLPKLKTISVLSTSLAVPSLPTFLVLPLLLSILILLVISHSLMAFNTRILNVNDSQIWIFCPDVSPKF